MYKLGSRIGETLEDYGYEWCGICGRPFKRGHGYDPNPIFSTKPHCCKECYDQYVIPTKFERLELEIKRIKESC